MAPDLDIQDYKTIGENQYHDGKQVSRLLIQTLKRYHLAMSNGEFASGKDDLIESVFQ